MKWQPDGGGIYCNVLDGGRYILHKKCDPLMKCCSLIFSFLGISKGYDVGLHNIYVIIDITVDGCDGW